MKEEKPRVLGLVFVKAKEDKMGLLIDKLRLMKGKKFKGCYIEIVAAMAGPFDIALIMRSEECGGIAGYVLQRLRTDLKDLVSDTQTYVLWAY